MTPSIKELRYIVFLIDSKYKDHDGEVFCSRESAQEYAAKCIEEHYCDKAVIGLFLLEPNAETMGISKVETFGFRGDKKVNQFKLF